MHTAAWAFIHRILSGMPLTWQPDPLRLSAFLVDTNKLQSEDRLGEEYEAEVRKIKDVYKDKRQILNQDMRLRLSLVDTDEEKAQLQEEQATKRRNITELQNIRLEQLRLRYEKKRATLLKANAKIIRT